MAEPPGIAVDIIRASNLGGLPHGFFGRRGGVSTGIAAGLNAGLGSGDEPDAIAENRSRAIHAVMPGSQLLGLYQVHSADCITVTDPWENEDRPHADAMVTDRPGLLLGILTADCAPVLLADPEAGIVAAAHAGWKGAIGGVTDNTIAAMVALGARTARIRAAIGPCIAKPSYEVDDKFREFFLGDDPRNHCHFESGRAGHWQFDLESYVATRLERAGIASTVRLGLDTYADQDRFFSFRRATHRGEPAYGRQISVIGLESRV